MTASAGMRYLRATQMQAAVMPSAAPWNESPPRQIAIALIGSARSVRS